VQFCLEGGAVVSDSTMRVHCREETGLSGTWGHHNDVGRSATTRGFKGVSWDKFQTLARELESKLHHSFILWFLFWMSRFLSCYLYYFSFLLSF